MSGWSLTVQTDEQYYDFEDWELADTQAMIERLGREAEMRGEA